MAGGGHLFPRETGLVHLSGVTDTAVDVADMLDSHRVMVDPSDRLGNIAQIKALLDGGYNGYFSFEPFAASVHHSPDIARDVRDTISYIENSI